MDRVLVDRVAQEDLVCQARLHPTHLCQACLVALEDLASRLYQLSKCILQVGLLVPSHLASQVDLYHLLHRPLQLYHLLLAFQSYCC